LYPHIPSAAQRILSNKTTVNHVTVKAKETLMNSLPDGCTHFSELIEDFVIAPASTALELFV
jgi:hypothetical protein